MVWLPGMLQSAGKGLGLPKNLDDFIHPFFLIKLVLEAAKKDAPITLFYEAR